MPASGLALTDIARLGARRQKGGRIKALRGISGMRHFFPSVFCLLLAGCSLSTPKHEGLPPGLAGPFDAARLSEYSTDVLLAYLTLDYLKWHCTNRGKEEIDWPITEELARRGDVQALLKAFQRPADSFQQLQAAWVLYHIDDPRVLQAFEQHPSTDLTEVTYACLNYRAKKGDVEALRTLNDNYYQYPVSSWQWSYTVRLFGDFNYRPAIPNLIDSVDAASLNVGEAALESLEKMFPGPHPQFKGQQEAKDYFLRIHSGDS